MYESGSVSTRARGLSRSAVFHNCVRDSELPASVKAVAWSIRSYMNTEGSCWPGRATIARGASVSDRTVDRSVKLLEAEGLLVVTRSPGGARRSNHYAVGPLVRAKHATTTANVTTGNGDTRSPESFLKEREGVALDEGCSNCGQTPSTDDGFEVLCGQCRSGRRNAEDPQ
jgi:hypothetical protein